MQTKSSTNYLLFLLMVFLLGSVIFLIGFFPISYYSVSDTKEKFSRPSIIGEHTLQRPSKQYERVFLIIVDAMRSDFYNRTTMPKTHQSACINLRLKVDIPTVTLPRIKSLMSGTLSGFSDIVLNLGSAEELTDSLLHSLVKEKNIITFAGDKAWTDLFPTMFRRQTRNTDSFYVNDFYEGDKNVTNALKMELQYEDWNLFIAHYLGLDHIGHVEGSTSTKISWKLREMDQVLDDVFTIERNKKSIILLTGDHGMRNGGGHGGSTKEELYVPLISLQKKCTKKGIGSPEFKQIDLAPTLAVLMSSEIPKQSIGCLIPDLIEEMELEEQLYAYYYNAIHLLKIANSKLGKVLVQHADFFKWLNLAKESHEDFLRSKRVNGTTSTYSFERAKQDYIRSSRAISDKISQLTAFFEYDFIVIGVALIVLVSMNALAFTLCRGYMDEWDFYPNGMQLVLVISSGTVVFVLCNLMGFIKIRSRYTCFLAIAIIMGIYIFGEFFMILWRKFSIFMKSYNYRSSLNIISIPLPILFCFIFHTCSLSSSSYIEEEHQTWYYLGSTALFLLYAKAFYSATCSKILQLETFCQSTWQTLYKMRSATAMLVLVAFLRRLNQTGDKWKHLEDVGDILRRSEKILWLSSFLILNLVLLNCLLKLYATSFQLAACVIASLLIYCYQGSMRTVTFFHFHKSNATNIIMPCFWVCVAFVAISGYNVVLCKIRKAQEDEEKLRQLIELLKTNLVCSLIIASVLHKPHNSILLSAMVFTLRESFKLCDGLHLQGSAKWRTSFTHSLVYKTAFTVLISKMFYFYQGNSNSLATIDLNPGYIGQSTYNPLIAATFVTLNTYSAQINAFLYFVLHLFASHHETVIRRRKKEDINVKPCPEITRQDLEMAMSLFTTAVLIPAATYFLLLIGFRYHLFIYSVFAPKALYECFNVIVFFFCLLIMKIYFIIVK